MLPTLTRTADATAAERVTFNKAVNARSVTLDGVVYDPAGTLTGGSRPQSASLLEQLQKINDLKDQLTEEKHKLQKLDSEFAKTRDSSREYQVLHTSLVGLFHSYITKLDLTP